MRLGEDLTSNNSRVLSTLCQLICNEPKQARLIDISANDRPGIVNEIAALLSSNNVNLESLETYCASAPMSAGIMFHAQAHMQLPVALSQGTLMRLLESLSDDLMVEVVDI